MKTHETYIHELAERNPSIECLGTYSGASIKVLHRCKVCGHKWLVRPYTLVATKPRGCPHCVAVKAGKANKSYNTETFIEALRTKHDEIELIGEYPGSHVKASFRCLRCGNEWCAMPYSVLQGHGCPRCVKTGTSFMEQVILQAVQAALPDERVLSRDKDTIGEELDIFIPSKSIAIEPGSWALHKRRLWKDEQKRKLCDKSGIRLIFLYDKFPSTKETPFSKNVLTFEGDFNKEDHEHLWNTINTLLDMIGAPRKFTALEKAAIESKAYENSKSMTHAIFIERVTEIHPTIEVLGKYTNTNHRIACRCTVCGREWDAIPASLLSGDGC